MRRASLLSLLAGAFLVAIKGVAWSFTDSLSMMSSLADSLLDVMASAVNFAAVRVALTPPDREHRFGHGKAEDLATLAQSTFIGGSGLFLIVEALRRLASPQPVERTGIGIAVMLVSIAVTLALVLYQRSVVRRTDSGAIAADALHYFADFLTNIGVIVALVLATSLGWQAADPLIGLAIAAYLIYGAFAMSRHALNNLMDREFSDEERARIDRVVRGHPEVAGLHDLRTRRSGIYCFIQFHLDLDPDMTLARAHEISDRVEDALLAEFPQAEILIHQDPLHGDRPSERQVQAAG